MPEVSSPYPDLEKWLLANANRPSYRGSPTNATGVECMSTAMADVQRMALKGSDQEILAFFSNLRKGIRQSASEAHDGDRCCNRDWPVETD